MKKNIMTLGAITVLGSGLFLFSMYEKKLLNREEITNNKSIAIYIKQEDGNYEKTNTIPESGYILNEEKSVCSNNSKPSWNINTKSLKINNLSSNNTSCYLYFDSYCKPEDTACQIILANKEIKTRDKITGPLTENTTGKMYAAADDDGMSYYFAGAVDNNFIKFAGYYWRIVRINGDGTIRIIYNGLTTDQTGETTQIGTSLFNENYDDNAYVGYMYGTPGSSTYEETHANINDSTIKKVVDNWYETNIANNSNFVNKIDVNAGFCNDRKLSTVIRGNHHGTWNNYGYAKNLTAYHFHDELNDENWGVLSEHKITLRCQENDMFTINISNRGNKKLQHPIGLITAPEVVNAGVYPLGDPGNNWLHTSNNYWTMTPTSYNGDGMGQFTVFDGALGAFFGTADIGVRPVINLKANVTITGDGTKDNPYIVEGA